VDEKLLERTHQYLLDRRDGQGGFKFAAQQDGQPSEHRTAAWVAWALTESAAVPRLDRELTALAKKSGDSSDASVLALLALGQLNQKQAADALPLLRRLRALQAKDGSLQGTPTIHDRKVEAVALTILGWARGNATDEFTGNIHKAVAWLDGQRDPRGGFGTARSTVLALKALLAVRQRPQAVDGSEVVFHPPGIQPGMQAVIAGRALDPVVVPLPSTWLHAGDNVLEIKLSKGTVRLPYLLTWSYHLAQPAAAAKTSLHLTTRLNKETAKEGEIVRLTTVLENRAAKAQGKTVAVVGLPSGLTLPEMNKQLQEFEKEVDRSAARISAWELRGRDLIFSWHEVAPNAKVQLDIDLTCRLPGRYRGSASRAYMASDSEHKSWADPLAIIIDPALEQPTPRASQPMPRAR
jgi:hypothetical protein